MAYGIVFWIAAVVLQAQEPVAKESPKPADSSAELNEARRLLENGRYAEAEEKLKAIGADAKKGATGLSAGSRATLFLELAECQATQGEYGKAIDGLKAAEADHPKNPDLPARLADLYLAAAEIGKPRTWR